MNKKFSGVVTALITPFLNGKVDFASLEKLVELQLLDGVEGFVINGTTAESPTLLSAERAEIFKFVKKLVPPNFPLWMGTGSNSTADTIENSKTAEKLGADALLVVVPYYNKPPQEGLFQHFKSVVEQTGLPLFMYNVPSRTVAALALETIQRLAEHPRIIGIKEASGNIEFAKKIRQSCPENFILLSGDDGSYDEFIQAGGDGVISVSSHLIPKQMKMLKARQHAKLIDLLFCEPSPMPVKMALWKMKVIASPECRLPLVTMSATGAEQLCLEMQKLGLLK